MLIIHTLAVAQGFIRNTVNGEAGKRYSFFCIICILEYHTNGGCPRCFDICIFRANNVKLLHSRHCGRDLLPIRKRDRFSTANKLYF